MQNWDHMCAECHSTNLEKRFDLPTKRYSTTYSEIQVACEACHGPGSVHVEAAQNGNWEDLTNHGLADVRTSRKQVENCAQCHSRKTHAYPGYTPGTSYYDHFLPELIEPYTPEVGQPVYHADGQIDDEVYVYGSFIQSKMYHEGVKCTDCHNPHTARLHAEGNALCMRCHSPTPEKPRLYDSIDHHHHQPGTPGASCVECHMPTKTYMVVDPRRDHSLRVPRPDLSAEFGTPNACNKCHEEKSSKWAADWVEKWHGPTRPKDLHFTSTVVAARESKPQAEPELVEIVRSKDASAFMRASALLMLRRYGSSDGFDVAAKARNDPEVLVRVAAISKLDQRPTRSRLKDDIAPLLNDSSPVVRSEAARVLSQVSASQFTQEERTAYNRAFAELEARHNANLDRPETHLSRGILQEFRNNINAAVSDYETALDVDPLFIPARFNLATLLSRQGNNERAESLLREVVRLRPDVGAGYYSLGLLVAESPSRLEEAAQILQKAAELMPRNARAQFNYGVSLWKLQRLKDAEGPLITAYELQPEHPDYSRSLAQLYMQMQKWAEAREFVQTCLKAAPNDRQAHSMLQQLNQILRQ